MPWSVDDVEKHNKDVKLEDKPRWVAVANETRDRCLKKGGNETMCDALAIATANAALKEAGMEKENLEEATWTAAFMNDLPDASFLYIAPGGEKDEGGKTTPRSLRYFPVKDASGKVDVPHLRNALARIPQADLPESVKDSAISKAQGLAKQHLPSYEEAAEMEGDFVPLEEKAVSEDGIIPIKIIQPGWGTSGFYGAEVLQRDAGVYKAGTKMYWNHPTTTEAKERPERSLNDLAAEMTEDAIYDAQGPNGPGLYAKAKVFSGYRGAIEELAPHIGLSHRAAGTRKYGEAEGRKGPIIEKIAAVQSVDFVTAPGAGGEILQLFEAARPAINEAPAIDIWGEITLDSLKRNRGDIVESLREEIKAAVYGEKKRLEEVRKLDEDKLKEMEDKLVEVEAEKVQLTEDNATLIAELKSIKEWLVLSEAHTLVTEKVMGADLPDITKTRLVESLSKNPPIVEGALDTENYSQYIDEAIKAEAEYIATIKEAGKIRGMGASEPREGNLKDAFKRANMATGMSEAEAEKLAEIAAKGR